MSKKGQICILGSVVISLLLAARTGAATVTLAIESPKPEAKVAFETLCKGKVSDPSEQVYVLVHPLKAKYWWVQRPPSPAGHDGRWQTLCYFGERNQRTEELYEVVALVTSATLTEGQQLNKLPKGARSEILTVRRSQ